MAEILYLTDIKTIAKIKETARRSIRQTQQKILENLQHYNLENE